MAAAHISEHLTKCLDELKKTFGVNWLWGAIANHVKLIMNVS